MPDHIVNAYDKELEALGRKIAEMGGIAEKMLSTRWTRSSTLDADLAHAVIASDPRLDVLQREIEEQRDPHHRAPPADGGRPARDRRRDPRLGRPRARRRSRQEHRQARASRSPPSRASPRAIVGLKHMNELAAELLKDVLDAYAQRDVERAQAVWARDAELDALEDSRVPRSPDLHDGRSAQHLVLHASPVLLEEHRADRRPRHQHRRDGRSISSPANRCRSTGRRAALDATSGRRVGG